MVAVEQYRLLSAREQAQRCKNAAALQLARLRAAAGDKEAAQRAQKIEEAAAHRAAVLELRRQRERKLLRGSP
jgi:hypothetical protein